MMDAVSDTTIIDALRKKGYRVTPQRIAIARSVLLSRGHPAAEAIYDEVKELHPTVSLATVYKTIHILKELNMVQELAFPEYMTRYDPYVKPHLNLVCRRCGRISDVEDPDLQEIISRTAQKARFAASGQRLDVYGVCQRCKASRSQN